MKRNFKTSVFVLGALAGGLLSACTNDESVVAPAVSQNGGLVKAPDFIAYSGGNVFGSTLGKRTNGYDGATGDQLWDQFQIPGNITAEERAAVLAALDAKTTGERISETLVFPWENYFLQDVVSAVDTDTPSKSYSFEAYNKGAECAQKWWPAEDFENYEEVTNNGQISHYYQDRTTNPQTRIDKTALMTDMHLGTYEEMQGKQFRWYINCHEELHWSEYIVVEVDGSYYICFDFVCGHAENQFVDGHKGRGCTLNDWDYNDWIIKISPAIPAGADVPPVWNGDENNEPEDTCDKCGHPSHGDSCDKCDEGKDCNEKVGEGEGDDTPEEVQPAVTDEVEINLHADKKNGEYLESHLSIHVRAATDVEVFIPVPVDYYCDADDMAIVQQHYEEYMMHGGPVSVEYNVGGHIVTMHAEFLQNGIRIWTEGVTEEVIAYCRETFGDGITFEVWNYFNDALDLEGLKGYLNQATVKFLDKCPGAYVNAFYIDEEGNKQENDCTVSIVDEQVNEFNDYREGMHLNGSPYNQIYDKIGEATE